jgi:CYTH domain-containing protein
MFSPEIRLRQVHDWTDELYYTMTIKLPYSRLNLIRKEYEFRISESAYRWWLHFKRGDTISKTRYSLSNGEYTFEYDVFHDQLAGLAYLEVEFTSEQEAQAFQPPSSVVKDVTEESAYKNASLAKNGLPADFITE